MCSACKHLGLVCEYKRPTWWGSNEDRRTHKDNIKLIIRRKKVTDKTHHNTIRTSVSSASSPPPLTHSLPTSATFSDPLDRTRSASIDSHFSFNFNSPPNAGDYAVPLNAQLHPDFMFNGYSPYEIDVKTERQIYVNDTPTLRESTTSTFSTFHPPPPPGTILSSFPIEGGEWTSQVFRERRESLTEECFDPHVFDFSHGPSMQSRSVAIELDEGDQRLLDHFVNHVLPTIFPILESNQHGSVASDLVLPALQNNRAYLHCCLSIAAQHYKATMGLQGEDINGDIMRHRYATINHLCQELNKDENHQQMLEATLGMIFFQCCVGRVDDDGLPDIAWHQHFQAAISLLQKLDLPRLVMEGDNGDDPTPTSATGGFSAAPPFNMTLAAWIDIIGATMQGRTPTFAHLYREKLLSTGNQSLGLRELMGCEDRVMYLISEIGCLEALRRDGLEDIALCQHVHALGEQLTFTEIGEQPPKNPFTETGALSPKQLSRNMTAAFRLAARIYLCSLVPGFHPSQASCVGLVEKLVAVLNNIPMGPAGFDRSLAWVYLIGGAVSEPTSSFRAFFASRVAALPLEMANVGSFGRVASLLREVWAQNDSLRRQHEAAASAGLAAHAGNGSNTPGAVAAAAATAAAVGGVQGEDGASLPAFVHWRDVMQMRGWDFLLI